MEDSLADRLNKVGARTTFESGSNREILIISAMVGFDTVSVGQHEARWDNETQRWVEKTK